MLDIWCFTHAEFKSEVYWFIKKMFSKKPYVVKLLTRPSFSEPTSYPALLADFIVSQTGINVKLFQ